MADEQLRLIASLKDNASAGIRFISKQLKGVRVEPGMQQAQKWVRGFNDDVAKFRRSSMTVASVMSSMGVTGLAAAGSIGALAAAFKGLADRTIDMRELGREVGLTADEINAMNRAGQHFGFDPSQMEGAIRHFAGLMPEFKRGYGELNNILARQPDLIKRLRVEDTKTQIKEIFDFLGTIKNPQDRMVFERGIFGTDGVEKLFKDGAGGFEAQAQKFRQTLAPITEQAAAQAQALRDAINDFNAAVDNLELKAGPTVYRWLTAGVRELGSVLQQVEKAPGDVAAAAAVIAGSLAALKVRNSIVRGSSLAGGGQMRAAAGQLSAAGAGLDKTAVTLNEAALVLREAALELRGRGGAPGGVPPNGGAKKPGAGSGSLIDKALGALAVIGLAQQAHEEHILDAPKNFSTRGLLDALDPNLGDLVLGKDAGRGAFHTPSAYDREMRARSSGNGQDHLFDGVVLGSLEKPILHLSGTLKTAAAQAEANGIKPAAFHPVGFSGSTSTNDAQALLASGVKEGMLAAMREWAAGASSADPSTARSGIMPASFGSGSGGGNPVLGGGSFGGGGGSYGNPSKSLLDFIAKSEGGGYNVSWGNGRFLPGGHEQNLTGKTLNEILALGDVMRRQPGARNSSAMGRYQITGSTLRDLMKRMGLSGSEKYDEAMQDRLASKLIADEGPRALQRWEGLKGGGRMSKALGLLRSGQIASQPALGGASGGGFTGKGDAVGIATSMLGFGEKQSAQALGHIMHAGEWCADFVNGVIEKSGGRGSGSAMANSFARWGRAVSISDAKRGDVIMENAHGRGVNHVGLVESVDHDKLGRAIGIHMVSGNYGHMVRRNLEPFNIIQGIRRGNEAGGEALRDAAGQLRAAAIDQRQAAHTVANVPGWHDPSRPDLAAEKRRAAMRDQEASRVEGGIDAHVHLHDHRTSTRVERRGAVRDASVNVRRAPQRTFTV